MNMINAKRMFLGVLMLAATCSATAQVAVPYRPLLKEGKVWKCLEISEGVGSKYDGEKINIYEWVVTFDLRIDGDTVIDGQSYKKVYRDDICEDEKTTYPNGETTTNHKNIGTTTLYTEFLREEGKKVYARRADANKEYLLYDFTLKAGDLLPSSMQHSGSYSRISIIDIVLAQGQFFRRYHLQPRVNANYVPMWIEGVGHPGGIFESVIMSNNAKTVTLESCYEDGICIFTKDDFYKLSVAADITEMDKLPDESVNKKYFNLQGRRLQGRPSKGLYIENGRKRVVK